MRCFFILVIVTLLSACASTSYQPITSNDGDRASIYVIRKRAEPTLWNLWIYIGKTKVASVANNSYVAFKAPLGSHTLTFDWPPTAASVKLEVPVSFSSGQKRYFEVAGKIEASGTYQGLVYYNESIQVVELSNENGEQILNRMKQR